MLGQPRRDRDSSGGGRKQYALQTPLGHALILYREASLIMFGLHQFLWAATLRGQNALRRAFILCNGLH